MAECGDAVSNDNGVSVITRRRFAAVLVAIFLLAGAPAPAAEWLIAVQAVPDSADAVYNQQAALTARVVAELGPPGLGAIGVDPGTVDAEIVICGHPGRTN